MKVVKRYKLPVIMIKLWRCMYSVMTIVNNVLCLVVCVCVCVRALSCSVVSDSLQLHGL